MTSGPKKGSSRDPLFVSELDVEPLSVRPVFGEVLVPVTNAPRNTTNVTPLSRPISSKLGSQATPKNIDSTEQPLNVGGYSSGPIFAVDPIKSRQEWTRLLIAGAILFVFVGIVTAAITAFFLDKNWEQLLTVLLAPITGLLGSALVFYFKTEDKRLDI